jgi:hypothetical protein
MGEGVVSYFDPNAAAKLVPLLRELARKHNLTLPELEAPPRQKAKYEAYVHALGREPAEVCRRPCKAA